MQHPTPEQLDEMARLGRLRMPYETGGVLLNGRLIEMENQADLVDQIDNYKILLPQLEEAIGDATTDNVLFWHTHPSGGVGPSTVDLGSRMEGFQYMVVALHIDGTHAATRY